MERAFGWLRWVDATFSTYQPDSEISRIDRGELPVRDAHPLVRQVLGRCERLRARDAGLLRRPRHWGGWTRRAWSRAGPDRAPPWRAAAGAAIDAGGDVLVGGRRLAGRDPPPVPPRAFAAAVRRRPRRRHSGAYERGEHIGDPHRGGRRQASSSVTVVGPDLATADAYATAAFAMGEAGPEWTARLRGYEAMTILAGDEVVATPGFLRYCAGGSVAASIRPVGRT